MRLLLLLLLVVALVAHAAPGYDVVLVLGGLNAEGRGNLTDSGATVEANASVAMLLENNTVVSPAADPLPVALGGNGIGPGLSFGLAYLPTSLAAGRTVLLVNCGWSDTGFDSAWLVGGAALEHCRNRTAVAAALPGGTHTLVAALWVNGEHDGDAVDANWTRTDLRPDYSMLRLMQLIDEVRFRFAGSSATLPFLAAAPVAGFAGTSVGRNAIVRVVAALPWLVPYTAVAATSDLAYTGTAYTAPAQRTLGTRLYAALATAQVNTAVTPLRSRTDLAWNDFYTFNDGANSSAGRLLPAMVNGTASYIADPSGQRGGAVYQMPASAGSTTFKTQPITGSATLAFWWRVSYLNQGGVSLWSSLKNGSTGRNTFTVNYYTPGSGVVCDSDAPTITFVPCATDNLYCANVPPYATNGTWLFAAFTSYRNGTGSTTNQAVGAIYLDGYHPMDFPAAGDVTYNYLDEMGQNAVCSTITQPGILGGIPSQAALYEAAGVNTNAIYDDVMLFNRTLTAVEVMTVYLQSSPTLATYATGGNLLSTSAPTGTLTTAPSPAPSATPTLVPSAVPSTPPTAAPSSDPTAALSAAPSAAPSAEPSAQPSAQPSAAPSLGPSAAPSAEPSAQPIAAPSVAPSAAPYAAPSAVPSLQPSAQPSAAPSATPSAQPSAAPTPAPTAPVPSVVLTDGPALAHSTVRIEVPFAAYDAGVRVAWAPLTSPAPCTLPLATHWRVLDSLSLTRTDTDAATFPWALGVRLVRSNASADDNDGVRYVRGRDLFVCDAATATWVPSSTLACDQLVATAAPADGPRFAPEWWVEGDVCHNTPFLAMEPVPSAACTRFVRLCMNCMPGYSGCACRERSADGWIPSPRVLTAWGALVLASLLTVAVLTVAEREALLELLSAPGAVAAMHTAFEEVEMAPPPDDLLEPSRSRSRGSPRSGSGLRLEPARRHPHQPGVPTTQRCIWLSVLGALWLGLAALRAWGLPYSDWLNDYESTDTLRRNWVVLTATVLVLHAGQLTALGSHWLADCLPLRGYLWFVVATLALFARWLLTLYLALPAYQAAGGQLLNMHNVWQLLLPLACVWLLVRLGLLFGTLAQLFPTHFGADATRDRDLATAGVRMLMDVSLLNDFLLHLLWFLAGCRLPCA